MVSLASVVSLRFGARHGGAARYSTRHGKRVVAVQAVKSFFNNFDEYKEQSRVFRQTTFDAEKWREHRSAKRYFTSVYSAPASGVLRGLSLEVFAVSLIALIVAYAPTVGVSLAISALPLQLTSPALGLLLVFRTNSAYARWWEARGVWGALVNRARDLGRQASTYIDDPAEASEMYALACAFAYSLKAHLWSIACEGDGEACVAIGTDGELVGDARLAHDLSRFMDPECLDRVLESQNRPLEISRELSRRLVALKLPNFRETKFEENISALTDYLGACERIAKTPIPLVYTRHTARFLSTWLLFVPSVLLKEFDGQAVPTVVCSAIIALFLLGIDELGIQIEEPFSVLPLDDICGAIEASFEDSKRMRDYRPDSDSD